MNEVFYGNKQSGDDIFELLTKHKAGARAARCDQRCQEKPGPVKGGRLAERGKNFWRHCTFE